MGSEIARNLLRGPHLQSCKQFYASHVEGKSRSCWRAGSLLFLRKSQEQLACVTQLKGLGELPSPSPSLPPPRVWRSCSQALSAGEAGPLNASPENTTLALRNRAFASPPLPPALSTPPRAEEEEGTGGRQCRQVTLQLRCAVSSADPWAYSLCSLVYITVVVQSWKHKLFGAFGHLTTQMTGEMCATHVKSHTTP